MSSLLMMSAATMSTSSSQQVTFFTSSSNNNSLNNTPHTDDRWYWNKKTTVITLSCGIKFWQYVHNLNYAIVIGPTHITWCAKINNVARFRQVSVMFPGNMTSRDPCFRRTWCKPRDNMHLRWFFGPTAVLGKSIHILCCRVMDDDTYLFHLSKLQTVLFNKRHPRLWNKLTLSVSLIHILVFHLLTILHKSDPHCHHHLCHH